MAATTPTGSRLTTPVPSVVRPSALGVSSTGSALNAGRAATSTVRRACFIGMPYCRNSADRKSVVEGKSVSVRVDPVGRRIIQKKSIKEVIKYREIHILKNTKDT